MIAESNVRATNRQVINAAAAALNISNGFQAEIPLITYQNGFSFSGPVKKLMNEQMKLVNLNWSIQNGAFQITEKTKTDEQLAIELGQRSGLIGTPTKTKDGVEFISLLNPELTPGRAVKLNSSRFLDGSGANIKVGKSFFAGDTHEGPWQVKCEGDIIT